jgi:hypothetical protein
MFLPTQSKKLIVVVKTLKFEILYDKHKQGVVGVGVIVGVNVGVLLIGKQFKQLPSLEGPYSVVITTLSPPLMLSTIV